ncbi:hypothetical protein Tco_0345738 [Tanacetum coccineum]
MGRGTRYYSFRISSIVDALVRSEDDQLVHVKFEISSWRGARVDVRTYLLGGAIDGNEANRIIRDSKVLKVLGENELKRIRGLIGVPREDELRNRISYGVSTRSDVDLRRLVSFNVFRKARCVEWLQELQDEGEFEWDDVAKTVFRMHNRHVEVYGYAFWVNQCTSGFHGVNEPGGVRVAREDDRGVTKGREYVRELFQQRRSGAKRKLSICGRNQLGNEPILALPEGADNFVVYYDARSKDLEACLEKGRSGYDGLRFSNWWLSMKKNIASCGSKYSACAEMEVKYKGPSGLLLRPEIPEWKWKKNTKDVIDKLPSLSSGYYAIGCSQ